jgi:hypothetical protein
MVNVSLSAESYNSALEVQKRTGSLPELRRRFEHWSVYVERILPWLVLLLSVPAVLSRRDSDAF